MRLNFSETYFLSIDRHLIFFSEPIFIMPAFTNNLDNVRLHCAFMGEQKVNEICDTINRCSRGAVEEVLHNEGSLVVENSGIDWPLPGVAPGGTEEERVALMNVAFYNRLEDAGFKNFAELFKIKIMFGTPEEAVAAAVAGFLALDADLAEEERLAEEQRQMAD